MATGHQDLHQLAADESVSLCDKCRNTRRACHVASLDPGEASTTDSARTEVVPRPYYRGGKIKGPMKPGVAGTFGTRLKALREAAGFTQEELATIAGLSVHAVSALERGERRRPHVETVRALSAALDLTGANRDALMASARPPAHDAAADELSEVGLPIAPTLLIGRDTDLQILQIWLADPTARLITLIGPGGVGKTRLALELARSVSMDGNTRVLFVPLAAIRNPAFVALAIAEALGLSDATALDLPARARAACGDHPTLLTLDNFEQVFDAAPLIAELLTSVASLRVLTTSRAPLRVRGEREYAVGSLGLDVHADAKSPADVVRSPAVRLFVERVRSVQPDFRLTVANSATVTAICRRLDALPLALEIAAPWIKVLTPEDLLAPAHARRVALDDRTARSSGAPADDQCDRGLELSASGSQPAACIPPTGRAAGPVFDRGRGSSPRAALRVPPARTKRLERSPD